ncbi:hypothetical protein Ddc_12717 [Ditylenchus destructor]|nr:hypothetical protein Ddc_12717 [Ditylenchus destructor]
MFTTQALAKESVEITKNSIMTNSNNSSWNQDSQVSSMENGLAIKEEPHYGQLMRQDRSLKQIEFCARLQAKLEKCRSELAACRAQKDDLMNVNHDLEARLGISEEKLQQTIDELAEIKMNETFADKMQKMAVQMQSKETKEIRAQLRKRETQIEMERKCHADLAAKLQTDNEKLTKQLEQSECSLKAEVEKILLKCKESEQAQESTNDLLTKKTEEAETLYSEIFKLKKQVRDVQNKTGRRSRENESLIGDLNGKIQMLNQKLEEEENLKKQHEETISQLEKDLGSCKAKLQQKSAQDPETFILQKKIDEMKAGFNAKDEMHKKVVEELAQTMSNLKQEQSIKMHMELQLKHRSDEMIALQQKLDLSRENYKAKEKKCVEYYTTMNQQKKDIESMQKHVVEVSQRNTQLIQKIRTVGIAVPQPEQKQAESKENIAELNTESHKNENIKKDLAELQHKLDNCRLNYTAKAQKCAELEKNLAKSRNKVLQLHQKLAESEARITKIEMEKKFESENDVNFFGDMKKELNEAKMQAQEADNARDLICQSLKEILQKAMSPVSHRKRLLLEPEQELRAIGASKRQCADNTHSSNMNENDNHSVTNGKGLKENTTDVAVFKTVTGENHAAQSSAIGPRFEESKQLVSSTTAHTYNNNRNLDPRIKR